MVKILISDAATIAQWKDALNDAWADLGELIDTRTQMLEASRELHKYFHDCKDVLGRILEKENSMSEELGRDSGSVSALLRKHQNFLQDLQGKYIFLNFVNFCRTCNELLNTCFHKKNEVRIFTILVCLIVFSFLAKQFKQFHIIQGCFYRFLTSFGIVCLICIATHLTINDII
jgi:hypothetical protein